MSKIEVFNEETGKTRMMGEFQFNSWAKNNGWNKKRKANKPAVDDKVETSNNDSTSKKEANEAKTPTSGDTQHSADKTGTSAIGIIKGLGKQGKFDEIRAFIKTESEGDSARSGVINAANKFLNA